MMQSDYQHPADSIVPQHFSQNITKSCSRPTNGANIVRFHEISIREFNLVPGDNPTCTSGCPIGIGWRIQREATIKVDEYEAHRPPRRTDLQIPADVRQDMLMREWEVPFSLILEAIRNCSNERELRRKSQRQLNSSGRGRRFIGKFGTVFSCVVPKNLKKKSNGGGNFIRKAVEARKSHSNSTAECKRKHSHNRNQPQLDMPPEGSPASNMLLGLDRSCRRTVKLLEDDDGFLTSPKITAITDKVESFDIDNTPPCELDGLDATSHRLKVRLPTVETLSEELEEKLFNLNAVAVEDKAIDGSKPQSCASDEEETFETDDVKDDDCDTISCEDEHEHENNQDHEGSPLLQENEISLDSSRSSSLLKENTDSTEEFSIESLDVTDHRTNAIGIMLAA